MMKAHLQAGETWFAGGAWTWMGFAPGNKKTMDSMLPAMLAAKKTGVKNIFLTMWGDNGKECSFWSVLPSLFAVRKYYEGETDMNKIKAEFKEITGENYDAFVALDLPNMVGGAYGTPENPCKHMLYSDPFFGVLDTTVKKGVADEYKKHAKILAKYSKDSKYAYLFDSMSALCKVLAKKYDLGVRTRKAYLNKDMLELREVINDYKEVKKALKKFHATFQKLWFTENKPNGFEVQDLRLGGLMQRLESCRLRLIAYTDKEIDSLPELEESLLDFFGGKENYNETTTPMYNAWQQNASVNLI